MAFKRALSVGCPSLHSLLYPVLFPSSINPFIPISLVSLCNTVFYFPFFGRSSQFLYIFRMKHIYLKLKSYYLHTRENIQRSSFWVWVPSLWEIASSPSISLQMSQFYYLTSWIIFHWVNAPHFHSSFISGWTSRLFSISGDCEQ